MICDPTSIPVERYARRAKTDRLDVIRLLMCLLAWLRGDYDWVHVIGVPSIEAEAQRHHVRDRGELQMEAMQHRDRTRRLLRTVGCWRDVNGDVATHSRWESFAATMARPCRQSCTRDKPGSAGAWPWLSSNLPTSKKN
ncbi:hypothetical protein [Cupriavidus basilensis]